MNTDARETLPVAIQTQITWAVNRAMTGDEFGAYAVSAKRIANKPERGTVTLANGQKRVAEHLIGNLTDARYLSYRTPAGRWKRCNAEEEATFVADQKFFREGV